LGGAYAMELNMEPRQVESQFDEQHYGLASEVVPRFVHTFLVGKVARADRP
ncbi:NAD-dependent protein deacylase, partial [Serratia marcescens]|nr:NAD-dependent protein deacylase [Serratia marcescens]